MASVPGDPVKVLIDHYQGKPAVTDVVALRISDRLAGTYPAIRVTPISTRPGIPDEDGALVQIECWADDDRDADDLARTVRFELTGLRGPHPAANAWCAGYDDPTQFRSPDQKTGRSRTIVQTRLYLYPL